MDLAALRSYDDELNKKNVTYENSTKDIQMCLQKLEKTFPNMDKEYNMQINEA